MPEPHELSTAECDRLLRSGVVGRMAITTPDGPHIVPINYSVFDDMVVVRTKPYSLLATYGRNAQIAFEIDHFDYEYQSGWSVVVHGRADTIDGADDIERINRAWPPRPWAAGQRNMYLGLRCTELTGVRLGGEIDPRRDLAVDRRAVTT